MMPLEFNFECVNKKRGICIESGTAGCAYDCVKMQCKFCIHKKKDRRREPCVGCFIGVKEG